jgi:mannitol/fructose-specific phosphotransferase system IIA component
LSKRKIIKKDLEKLKKKGLVRRNYLGKVGGFGKMW